MTEEEKREKRRKYQNILYHKKHPNAAYREPYIYGDPKASKLKKNKLDVKYYHLKHPNAKYKKMSPKSLKPLTAKELRDRQLSYYHDKHPNAKYRKEKEIVRYIVKLKNGYIEYIETIAGVTEYGTTPETKYAKVFNSAPSRTAKTVEKNVGYKPQIIFLK